MIMAFVSTQKNALEQRVSKQSSIDHSLPVSDTLPSCLKQGLGRRCTNQQSFQLNSRELFLIKRREVCNSYQKWSANSILARADGSRMANPQPRYSPEAAQRTAVKLAKQFKKKPAPSTDGEKVALPADKTYVEERNFSLDRGASYNIIGRDELTESEWETRKSIPTITLNTAAGQIVVDESVEVYVRELDNTFIFLLLPECQPVLSMGQWDN